VKNVKEEYEAKIGYFQRQIVELKNEKEGFSGIVKKQSSVSIINCFFFYNIFINKKYLLK